MQGSKKIKAVAEKEDEFFWWLRRKMYNCIFYNDSQVIVSCFKLHSYHRRTEIRIRKAETRVHTEVWGQPCRMGRFVGLVTSRFCDGWRDRWSRLFFSCFRKKVISFFFIYEYTCIIRIFYCLLAGLPCGSTTAPALLQVVPKAVYCFNTWTKV